MRPTTLRRLTLLAALAVAPAALAAPPKDAPAAREPAGEPTRLGLGLALSGADTFNDVGAPINVYVPIDLGRLRLEPWLGFGYRGSRGLSASSTVVGLGAGAFLLVKGSRTIQPYLGGRLGLNIVTIGSQTQTDVALLPAAGVEWMADPHFSVGIEGQLGLVFHSANSSSTDFGTNGLLFLRTYL